jgi:hypothetical protein
MHLRTLGPTRPRTALVGALALMAWVVVGLPAHAQIHPLSDCGVHSTPSDMAVALATVSHQLATTEKDFDAATVASPAAWRLHEERDRLRMKYSLLSQLRDALAARDGATPRSPAQWRAQESSDALCEHLRGDG